MPGSQCWRGVPSLGHHPWIVKRALEYRHAPQHAEATPDGPTPGVRSGSVRPRGRTAGQRRSRRRSRRTLSGRPASRAGMNQLRQHFRWSGRHRTKGNLRKRVGVSDRRRNPWFSSSSACETIVHLVGGVWNNTDRGRDRSKARGRTTSWWECWMERARSSNAPENSHKRCPSAWRPFFRDRPCRARAHHR